MASRSVARCCSPSRSRVLTDIPRVLDADQRPSLRRARARPQSHVRHHGRVDAGPRNQREHGDLQCHRLDIAAPAAVRRARPDRDGRGQNREKGLIASSVAYPDVLDWRANAKAFEEIAVIRRTTYNFAGEDQAERASGARVSANFFRVFGARPQLGRSFTAREETLGRERVVVLSDAYWRRRFGGDRDIIGRQLSSQRMAVHRRWRDAGGICVPARRRAVGAVRPRLSGAPSREPVHPGCRAAGTGRDAQAGHGRAERDIDASRADVPGIEHRLAGDRAPDPGCHGR